MSEAEIQRLKQEIEILQKKLKSAHLWMEREVKASVHKISKKQVSKFSEDLKESFLRENIEDVISSRINNFFWDLLLLNAPNGTIEAITNSEIAYFNMTKNPNTDGFSVISGYHKVLDLYIESFVSNNYRKFCKKNNQIILRVNDPLEKALNLVVTKKYILSVGRFYALIKMIRESEKLYDYWLAFKKYTEKYFDLNSLVWDDDFFVKMTALNKSEVLSSKRHSGNITKKETWEARDLLIWDFKDKKSILYKLLETQAVNY